MTFRVRNVKREGSNWRLAKVEGKPLTGGQCERYIARYAMTDTYLGPKQHLLAIGGLVLGAVVLACAPSAVMDLQYQCMLHWMTGLRCPFCGMTRDFILMAHGSRPRNNPGSLFVALALYGAYPIWLIIAAVRGGSILFVRRDGVIRGLIIIMAVLFICNNLVL